MLASLVVRGAAAAMAVTLAIAGASCGPDVADRPSSAAPTSRVTAPDAVERTREIDELVVAWGAATSLAAAQADAEGVRNLVTGDGTLGAGDLDDDGRARRVPVGLMPSATGTPGLASRRPNACVERDVLGGDWTRSRARWDELARRIADWTPENNTFPALPSHPQRVVGWASLTLATDSLDDAHEYAGHAKLHVDVTLDALTACAT